MRLSEVKHDNVHLMEQCNYPKLGAVKYRRMDFCRVNIGEYNKFYRVNTGGYIGKIKIKIMERHLGTRVY
jgi:hypothetical protein